MALRIFRKHRSMPGTTGALANIGQAHTRLGRRRRSLRVNRKTLKLAARYGFISEQARVHADAALLHAKRGKLKDALKSAEMALKLYRQVDNPLGVAMQLADIASLSASQRKTEEARRKLGAPRQTRKQPAQPLPPPATLLKKG
jgi:tetratricopeptide (TPR) repeat protein